MNSCDVAAFEPCGRYGLAMNEFTQMAFVCRQRADELRQLAETMSSKEARESLLRTAVEYDRMAARQDALAEGATPKVSK